MRDSHRSYLNTSRQSRTRSRRRAALRRTRSRPLRGVRPRAPTEPRPHHWDATAAMTPPKSRPEGQDRYLARREVPGRIPGDLWPVGRSSGGPARRWTRRGRRCGAAAAVAEGPETPSFAVTKWHDEYRIVVELLLSHSIPTYFTGIQCVTSPVRVRGMMTLILQSRVNQVPPIFLRDRQVC